MVECLAGDLRCAQHRLCAKIKTILGTLYIHTSKFRTFDINMTPLKIQMDQHILIVSILSGKKHHNKKGYNNLHHRNIS